jgi:alkaline phosphatase
MSSQATSRTPLLARERRASEHSEQRAAEDDAALHGEPDRPPRSFRAGARAICGPRVREVILFLWALAATAGLIVLAVWFTHTEQTGKQRDPISTAPASTATTKPTKPTKRNLVFMVSDGMGPTSLSLTRSYHQLVSSLPYNDSLRLDQHLWGTSRTRSSNSLVTDSAAGATAFACGRKTYNGAISMLPGYDPCGTVLEAAHRAGYKTGLVVTTDVTDATPACFASHVYWRMQGDEIAMQETGLAHPLGRVVDLIMGGGRCRFLGNDTEGSCRQDGVDVVALARRKHGWDYVDDRPGFDALQGGTNVSLPLLGLFAGTDIPFEIDRRHMGHLYPSLSEMATTALTALDEATKDSDQGFFLMIEGSRIDHAGHGNDPAAQVVEVLEYDKTFGIVLDFLEKSETEGVLVATSDHETGGLATAWRTSGPATPTKQSFHSITFAIRSPVH